MQYLGVSGLFSNILTMLALSDLGVYTVMVYSLYEPVANRNEERISALVQFFQKLYTAIGIVVLLLGVACIPLLPYLVNNSTLSQNEIVLYYLLLLLNSVCSYIGVSRATLLQADQQMHIVHLVTSTATIGVQILQIIVLILTRQYVIYLAMQIIVTLSSNLTLSYVAGRKYPYIRKKADETLVAGIKGDIVKNLKATFLYKLGNAVMNSTDNVLISVIVGTVFVGYYSSYVTIFTLVNTFIMLTIQSMLSSVGNYYATHEKQDRFEMFAFLLAMFYMLATFCAGCYICGMNDFISIWLGEEFLLDNAFVIVLALYRFVFCAIHPLWITRESCGVFLSTRYLMMSAAVVNIILSVVLGNIMGIHGVILATALAHILTICWYEPHKLCDTVFGVPYSLYWKSVFRLLLAVVVPIGCAIVLQRMGTHNLILLFVKFLACGVTTLLSFYIVMRNSKEFQRLKIIVGTILKRKFT